MKKRKYIWIVVPALVLALLCTSCRKKETSGDDSPEGNQTSTEQSTEMESQSEPETEPETKPAGSSMQTLSYDGKKTETTLSRYGRAVYDSTFADMAEVREFTYVYVGDGVEIYLGDTFCGWFAAWDFSDMAQAREARTVSLGNLDTYIKNQFSGTETAVQAGKKELTGNVTRYEYELERIAEDSVQWLMEKGLAESEDAAKERCTYPASVYAYMAGGAPEGYLLYLDRSVVSDTEADALADALTFAEDSFTAERRVPVMEKGIQDSFAQVESALPYMKELQTTKDWFEDYDGGKQQRIAGTTDDDYRPSTCPDIVFYRADEGEGLDEVMEAMFEMIMEPLTEKSETRGLTVTDYFLDTQTFEPYEERENMWILPYLNGYYAYEGLDVVAMEDVVKNGDATIKDGMIPLMRQGGPGEFQFALVKEGDVYRLQRARDMGVIDDAEDWK